MTARAADKILQGLRDVIDGNFARATFIGIDWGRKDWTAVTCPRCTTGHRWRKRTPKRCRHCGLEFKFTANESTTQAVALLRPHLWPDGCHDPDSCARHKACMYMKCRHDGRSIAGEVESAEATLTHPSHHGATHDV